MLTYILFAIGFVLLIKGANFLVEGGSSLAKRWKISEIVIGLTIISFGTSMPELIINLFASSSGATDLAIGNIIGSNIANIFLVLGVSAVIYPLITQENTSWREIPFGVLAALLVGIMANDMLIDGSVSSVLTRIDGLVLLLIFLIFMVYIFTIAKKKEIKEQAGEIKTIPMRKSLLFMGLGIVGLGFGGKWIVDGAVQLASSFGRSQSLIGLTVVAIGTSLPELATSAVAAYKKRVGIAIGNVVGSNIFNIFWVLGISAVVRPLPFNTHDNINVLIMIFASVLLFIFLFIGKKHILHRRQGVMFLIFYVSYILFLVMTA